MKTIKIILIYWWYKLIANNVEKIKNFHTDKNEGKIIQIIPNNIRCQVRIYLRDKDKRNYVVDREIYGWAWVKCPLDYWEAFDWILPLIVEDTDKGLLPADWMYSDYEIIYEDDH